MALQATCECVPAMQISGAPCMAAIIVEEPPIEGLPEKFFVIGIRI